MGAGRVAELVQRLGWFCLSFPYRGSHVKRLSNNSCDVRDRGDHRRLSIHLMTTYTDL